MTLVWIVFAAVFPQWARWPTRPGVRGTIAYAGFSALVLFAVGEFVRYGRRLEGDWAEATDDLRRQLGREPTEREVAERVHGVG